jgi:hypothetical protein
MSERPTGQRAVGTAAEASGARDKACLGAIRDLELGEDARDVVADIAAWGSHP